MSDLDELLRSFRARPVDEDLVPRIARSVAGRTLAPSPPARRSRRRWLAVPAIALLAGAALYLVNPFSASQLDPAEAFARALTRVASSGSILHVRTTTRILNTRARVDLSRPLVGGQRVVAESWSTRDGYLHVRYVGRHVTVYTATPSGHATYLGAEHRLTRSRWASPAERTAFLRDQRVFDPQTFLRSIRRGIVRFAGRTTWQGRPALRFRYRQTPDGYTVLVDPKTYRPIVDTDTYPINGGRGGTAIIQTIYTTFETIPRTPSTDGLLRFTPPAGTEVRRDDPAPYRRVSPGDALRPPADALLSSLAAVAPPTTPGTPARRSNPPLSERARAIVVEPLAARSGQWILYEAPRLHGGPPCYAFVENRRDGLGNGSSGWSCDVAGRDFSSLGLSPDGKTFELQGHQTGPARGQPPVTRIVLVVAGRRYPVELLANGLFIGVAPATGSATAFKYAADGRVLGRSLTVSAVQRTTTPVG